MYVVVCEDMGMFGQNWHFILNQGWPTCSPLEKCPWPLVTRMVSLIILTDIL